MIYSILIIAIFVRVILWINILATIILSLQPGCTEYKALQTAKTIIYSYLKNDKMIYILMNATVINVILRIVILRIVILVTIILSLQPGCTGYHALHTVKTTILDALKNDITFFILMNDTVISIILRIVILATIILSVQQGCTRFQALHTVKTIIYSYLKNDILWINILATIILSL